MLESHKVLDNSFLSKQVHLTNHITELNYQACLDIVTAMGTYNDFINISRELTLIEEIYFRDLIKRLDALNILSEELFCKLSKEAVEKMKNDYVDVDNELSDIYDDLSMAKYVVN